MMKRYTSGLAALLILGGIALGSVTEAGAVMDIKDGVSGKVVETMTAGDYTYVKLEKDKQSAWVAAPVMKVEKGQELAFVNCTPMMDFESKALKRTFDMIMFCGQPLTGSAAELLSKKSTGSNVAVPELKENISREGVKGDNVRTVAECYEQSAELDKKTVVVKGKVMKVSNGIMRSNWLHLQDGSGSASQKNNDLVVTTDQNANVGDTVVVSGTLAKNKDFGSGYKYAVIIEHAKISK